MSSRSNRRWAWIGAIACAIYLFNPGWGVIELIPDNIPGIGNLDEAGVTLLLVQCIRSIRSKDKPPA